MRINQQWRICFTWTPAGPENVEIVHGKRPISADTAVSRTAGSSGNADSRYGISASATRLHIAPWAVLYGQQAYVDVDTKAAVLLDSVTAP